ncbi:hypothetical protein SAMN05444339_10970 [Loktanella atrilutea]|uniref:Uncharacterized protein n=1 Tax=Loktanella atrilutea TaxID=366533 RepID=A0A1M5D8L6_LOKAT|nr:hypothetical protein [Loktanella atrilutea]SHF63210.1 hypothetical protein SAMN05444339_10970 [Loktanella atrilutea]
MYYIPHRNPAGGAMVAVSGLIAAVIAAYAFLMPLTGVNNTAGPLLVILAGVLLIIGGLILRMAVGRGLRITMRILILLALAGTAVAGLLLHQNLIALAMIIGLIGVIIDIIRPGRTAA